MSATVAVAVARMCRHCRFGGTHELSRPVPNIVSPLAAAHPVPSPPRPPPHRNEPECTCACLAGSSAVASVCRPCIQTPVWPAHSDNKAACYAVICRHHRCARIVSLHAHVRGSDDSAVFPYICHGNSGTLSYCYPPLDTTAILVDPHELLRVMSLTRKRTATPVPRYVWTTVPAPARQDSRVSRRLMLSYLLSASRLYRHLSVVMPTNDIVHCTQTWLLLNNQ